MNFARRHARGTLLYLLAWGPVALLYVVGLRQTAAANWATAAVYAFHYLLPAAVVGCVWRIATARLAWREWPMPRILATEFAIALAFVGVWHALFAGLLLAAAGAATVRSVFTAAIGWQLAYALLIYAVHAAAFHAVRIFAELKAQQLAAAEADAARARAEMLALRGQLDPHFLFNSLHSITALVRDDPPRAEEALLQFSALLRRVLAVKRDSADEVTLADEMRFVDDYLAIERLRLGERLRVNTEISAEANTCRLPAFSVQPLVENAIHHAIAPRRDGGALTLRAAVRAGRIEILVHDDGPGADPAAVARATGVGLSVIRQRLRLRHGDHASLVIDTAPGKGFGVTLALPAEMESEVGRVCDPPFYALSPRAEGGSQTRPTPPT